MHIIKVTNMNKNIKKAWSLIASLHTEITMINILWFFPSYFLSMWHTIRASGSIVDSFFCFCFLAFSLPSSMYLGNSLNPTLFPGGVFSTQAMSVGGLHCPHPPFRDITQQANYDPHWKHWETQDCALFYCYFIFS